MQTTTVQANEHQQHPHDEEACSPFCSCACCGQTIPGHVSIARYSNNKVYLPGKTHPLTPDHFIESDFFGNIWQPPKIS
jgi:hypothetical protein